MSNDQIDADLLRRYASENSEEAFAALVERHLSLVPLHPYTAMAPASPALGVTWAVLHSPPT